MSVPSYVPHSLYLSQNIVWIGKQCGPTHTNLVHINFEMLSKSGAPVCHVNIGCNFSTSVGFQK